MTRCYWFLAFLISTVYWSKANADVFTVTSNADSGPGTLREALTLAAGNGSTVKDFINFNLPDVSEAEKTITLESELPYVSSNLVIDGTTQPGASLGRSNAKIIIQPNGSAAPFNALTLLDADGFELYGLYIRDFNGEVYYYPNQGVPNKASALYIENSSNVQIGAPGKGNVFANDGFTESNSGASLKNSSTAVNISVKNFKFYANIVGFEPDGKTYRGTQVYYNGGGLQLNYCAGDIRIGDDDVLTRNYFGNGAAILNAAGPRSLNPSTFLIKNNYFSYDIDGNPSAIVDINAGSVFVILMAEFSPIDNLVYPYSIKLINNKFQWPYSISIGEVTGDIIVQGNSLLFEQSVTHPSYNNGFISTSHGNILVGGENPGEANILYGTELNLYSRKSVVLQRNSIYCVNAPRSIWFGYEPPPGTPSNLPVIEITRVTPASVSGTATPLSKVELFWDDDCHYCQPLTYIITVTTDADGKWIYNGAIQKGVIASATLNGFTSYFTQDATVSNYTVQHTSCGQNEGAISVSALNSGGFLWQDENGLPLGATPTLTKLAPGKYTLLTKNGSCSNSYTYEILDATPKIVDTDIKMIQPSCNVTGSITSLYLDNYNIIQNDYGAYTYKWFDATGKIRSTTLDLTDAEAGTYHLEITYKDKCTTNYGPITLKNQSAPTIDQSNALLTNATCDNYDGSIKGLKVSPGSFIYFFTDQNGKIFTTTSPDIDNIPAGTYTLNVKYGDCPPVQSTPITLLSKNGVSIDFVTQGGRSATCNESNGEIIGLSAPGATSYAWKSKSGSAVLSDKLDLKGVPSGIYTLTISNATCSKDIDFEIPGFPPTLFTGITYTNTKTCQAFNTGSITVNTDNANEQPLKYRWVNTTGENVGFDKTVQFLPIGTYRLYLTDKNYCENPYPETYTIGAYPEFKVVTFGTVTNTQCGVGTGGVTATTVTGGTGNYVYQWLDAGNNTISSQTAIENLAPGAYKLRITDGGCSLAEIPYNITDEAATPPAPFADNVRVYNPGKITIKVNDPFPTAIYRLYETATSQPPLKDAIGGEFNIDITESRSYYVSLTYGYCESDRTEVNVFVSALKGGIANTFTPNGDGVNDYWVVEGLSTYPDVAVSVFNRYGQAVFQSIGYAKPFDGNHNGKPLPAGVYYYLIDLKNNNRLSGNVSILR